MALLHSTTNTATQEKQSISADFRKRKTAFCQSPPSEITEGKLAAAIMLRCMGRPPSPSIAQIASDRWRVCATVNGRRKKKVVRSREEADALLHSWAGARPLPLLPTRLAATSLRQAEAAHELLASIGLDLLSGARWIVQHYKPGSSQKWADAWEEYARLRGQRASKARLNNVKAAFYSYAASTGRPDIGCPTRDEVERWLSQDLAADCMPATYNHRLNDLSAPFAWLCKRGVIVANPCTQVDRRQVKRGTPTTLLPSGVESALRWAEQNCPEWVPWLAVMVFGGVRPGLREMGECRRMSDALEAGKIVFLPGGLLVDGKAHGERVVPWEACGPLRQWLEAYPLRPLPPPARAERDWTKLRAKLGLQQDVLRHTAASCMCYSGTQTLAEIALALGNSEVMLRRHYIGRWSREMTGAVWSLLPANRPSAHTSTSAA